jgi:cobalt/nickel transport system permease protein
MKVPKIFAVQLLLLYRYIYLLIEEVMLIVRAHNLRAFKNKIKIRTFVYLISHLLLRSIDRSNRIYLSMLSKGFNGNIFIASELKIELSDILFTILWILYFSAIRFFPVTEIIGNIFKGLLI